MYDESSSPSHPNRQDLGSAFKETSGLLELRCSGSGPKVTWDEAVIREHDKERGTRMKIEEPKTPYYMATERDVGSDGFTLDSTDEYSFPVSGDELKKRLEQLCGEKVPENIERIDASFESRRGKHYDEFRMVQQLRMRGREWDEDEDWDDNGQTERFLEDNSH